MSGVNINQVRIKRGYEELFGLEISYRRGFEFNLYDFEIEQFISLAAFQRITGIDPESFDSCRGFLDRFTLFQLNSISEENSKEWQRGSIDFISSCESKWSVDDSTERLTISMNTMRGSNFL
jgi:hypothetical protein